MLYPEQIIIQTIFLQDTLPKGATIIPILFGVDETRVNVLGRMSCWPLYLSIGNLPKAIRRNYSSKSYVLVGYLPILEGSGKEVNKPSYTEAKRVLYHHCMRIILKCLDDATQRYDVSLVYLENILLYQE